MRKRGMPRDPGRGVLSVVLHLRFWNALGATCPLARGLPALLGYVADD